MLISTSFQFLSSYLNANLDFFAGEGVKCSGLAEIQASFFGLP